MIKYGIMAGTFGRIKLFGEDLEQPTIYLFNRPFWIGIDDENGLLKSGFLKRDFLQGDKYGFDLRILDNFTLQFKCEEELRSYLKEKGLLNYLFSYDNDYSYDFSGNILRIGIVHDKAHRMSIIKPLGFIWKDDLRFITGDNRKEELLLEIQKKKKENDVTFFAELSELLFGEEGSERNRNSRYKDNKELADRLSLAIIRSRSTGILDTEFVSCNEQGEDLITQILNVMIFDAKKEYEGYRCLHSVIVFLRQYDERERLNMMTVCTTKKKVVTHK